MNYTHFLVIYPNASQNLLFNPSLHVDVTTYASCRHMEEKGPHNVTVKSDLCFHKCTHTHTSLPVSVKALSSPQWSHCLQLSGVMGQVTSMTYSASINNGFANQPHLFHPLWLSWTAPGFFNSYKDLQALQCVSQ